MTHITLDFESDNQAALFLEHGGLPALGVTLSLMSHQGAHIEYQGNLSTRLWDGCRQYVEECGGTWTAVSTLDLDSDEQLPTIDIEQIATDRYRVRARGQLITLSAHDLLEIHQWCLLHGEQLEREAKTALRELAASQGWPVELDGQELRLKGPMFDDEERFIV